MYVCHESGIAGYKWDVCTGLESGEDGVSENIAGPKRKMWRV
jgi:hypothetical protein